MYYNPYIFNNYNNAGKYSVDTLMKVIDKGIELMSHNISLQLLQAWQDYSKTAVKMVSDNYDMNIYINYLNFITSILRFSPYEQLKMSIEELMNISRRVTQIMY